MRPKRNIHTPIRDNAACFPAPSYNARPCTDMLADLKAHTRAIVRSDAATWEATCKEWEQVPLGLRGGVRGQTVRD